MGMKFRVKDDDGRDYVVEELEEEKVIPPEVKDDDEALSAEEIKGLRELLAHGPQLLALLKEEHEEHAEDACEEEEEEEVKDEELLEEEEKEEELIEDEGEEEILETKSHDSKKAFGSIEQNKKTLVDDSLTDNVSDAWAKRYNGGKR